MTEKKTKYPQTMEEYLQGNTPDSELPNIDPDAGPGDIPPEALPKTEVEA